jgi:methyl-accepting chemotaxis protein
MAANTTDIRRRVVLVGMPVTIAIIGIGAYGAAEATAGQLQRSLEREFRQDAQRASSLVTSYLQERTADVRLVANAPSVVSAARNAGLEAVSQGLDRLPTADLEQQFAEIRTIGSTPAVTAFLISLRDSSDFTEIFFTESNGFTVSATNPTSDFVQSDEEWWEFAWNSGAFRGVPTYDESAGTVGVELAVRITDAATGEGVGVLKALVAVSRLAQALAVRNDSVDTSIEVVDETGRVLIATDERRVFTTPEDAASIPRARDARTAIISSDDGGVLVATAPTNDGRWWVVTRRSQRDAFAAARSMRQSIYIPAGVVLVFVSILLTWLTDWLRRRVTQPVRAAGVVAGRVAAGDLSASLVTDTAGSAEVRHLLESVATMVGALRRLVGEIRGASQDSAAMAEQISAATEQMSASTQEMADTCQDLSSQATDQADLARQSVADATRILGISTHLADGASVAAGRSALLVDTATEHRERLIEGSARLGDLASDLETGAADAERLAHLSEQIEQFLVQARTVAAQTNMLALNAAIEASRAGGGEGRGFEVVADEVRKLATQTARSAASTSDIVRNMLTTVQQTRGRLVHLAEASAGVRQIAEAAANALEEVGAATAESSAWSEEISKAATEVKTLVEEITRRLESIAHGTESVVAASEEIAASAEQQSASTEEIAASAAQLANASDKLTQAVGTFRLLGRGTGTVDDPTESAAQPAEAAATP